MLYHGSPVLTSSFWDGMDATQAKLFELTPPNPFRSLGATLLRHGPKGLKLLKERNTPGPMLHAKWLRR